MAKSVRIWAGGIGLLLIGASVVYLCLRPSPMNVIIVTLDTTRADRMGCYGYRSARTPALDRLAKQGVLFEKAYAPVPVTLPSHASIFTGLYPPEHGLHHNGRGKLGSDVPLLAEILRRANYDAAAFLASFVLDSKFGLDRGFQTYDDTPDETERRDHHGHHYRDGRTVVDAALAWLAGHTDRPFLCWVHLYDAHAPYRARPEIFQGEFAEQPYDAGIAYADLQLQRLLDFVRSHQLDRRTLIVVVGDHGEGLNEHQEVEHGYQLYNSTLQVPLVIFDPRSNQAGYRVPTAVSLVDLTPTILDCLGISPSIPMTGRTVKAALSGKMIESRAIYAESDVPYMYSRWSPLLAVVTERWKYVKTTLAELYDLQNDPHELDNLALDDPDRCLDYENALHELQANMTLRESASVNLSGAERSVLKSLGYVAGRGASADQPIGEALPDVKEMMPYYNLIEESRRERDKGNATEAIQIIRDVVNKAPGYLAARVALGDALLGQKEYLEAASIFAAVVAVQPDFTEAYASWGDALCGLERYQEAVPRYRKALELDSSSAVCRFNLSSALVHLGRISEAVTELNEVVRTDPNYAEAHVQLGGLFAQNRQNEDAIAQFEIALKHQPDLVIAHANLGSLFAQEGRFEHAVQHASQAVKIDPQSFEARYTLGAIFFVQGNYRKAVAELTEACRLRPDDPAARQQLQRAKAALAGMPP